MEGSSHSDRKAISSIVPGPAEKSMFVANHDRLKPCKDHPLYPMIQPNFYIEELIQNTMSRARMDSSKLTMF